MSLEVQGVIGETTQVREFKEAQIEPVIHPTAVVHPSVVLGRNVIVGAYSIIEAGVVIGDDSEVMHHVSMKGPTVIGRGNRFYPFSSIGDDPQDKKYDGQGESGLEIGDHNVFREFSTIHRGTATGRGTTRMGSHNWIMNYCHVAHDCLVGNHTIFANNAILGGHVTVEDRVQLGGFTAVHQYCTVGAVTMTGAHTMVAQDVVPYVIATGNRVKLYGVNRIGLERNGYTPEEIENVKQAYRIYFRSKLSAKEGLARMEAELSHSPAVATLITFIKNSKRGIAR